MQPLEAKSKEESAGPLKEIACSPLSRVLLPGIAGFAGGAAGATLGPVGAVAGGSLAAGSVNAAQQKYCDSTVDLHQVALAGAAGAFAGTVGVTVRAVASLGTAAPIFTATTRSAPSQLPSFQEFTQLLNNEAALLSPLERNAVQQFIAKFRAHSTQEFLANYSHLQARTEFAIRSVNELLQSPRPPFDPHSPAAQAFFQELSTLRSGASHLGRILAKHNLAPH